MRGNGFEEEKSILESLGLLSKIYNDRGKAVISLLDPAAKVKWVVGLWRNGREGNTYSERRAWGKSELLRGDLQLFRMNG